MLIKDMRDKRGITQKELAECVGVGQTAVAMWESGKVSPTADKLPVIACALGCGINDLFAKDGKEVEG